MLALPATTWEERERLVELGAEVVADADRSATDGLDAIRRLALHLLRERMLPELLDVLRFEEDGLQDVPVVPRGRIRPRWYARYPFFDDAEREIPWTSTTSPTRSVCGRMSTVSNGTSTPSSSKGTPTSTSSTCRQKPNPVSASGCGTRTRQRDPAPGGTDPLPGGHGTVRPVERLLRLVRVHRAGGARVPAGRRRMADGHLRAARRGVHGGTPGGAAADRVRPGRALDGGAAGGRARGRPARGLRRRRVRRARQAGQGRPHPDPPRRGRARTDRLDAAGPRRRRRHGRGPPHGERRSAAR